MTRSPGLAPERLDGWKEIAAYVRRSVRTVQRWEAQLGLPVHRVSTGGADSVYAVPAELDQWLNQSKDARDADSAAAAADSISEALQTAARMSASCDASASARSAGQKASAGRFARRPWIGMASVLAGVTILAVVAWQFGMLRLTLRPSELLKPSAVTVDGRALVIRAADGTELGRHTFEDPLDEFQNPADASQFSSIADLDGSGQLTVIIARGSDKDTGVYGFAPDGSQRFRWKPNRRVTYGDAAPFGPHLMATGIFLPPKPDGTFYVAAHVLLQFPAVLLHLDKEGTLLHEYWNDGYIQSFLQVESGAGVRTYVGGMNNELKAAGLAIFDGAPSGYAPSVNSKYRCADCPGGPPAAYLAFPASRVQKRLDCTPGVEKLWMEDDRAVTVGVTVGDNCTLGRKPTDSESAYYTVDAGLRIIRVDVGDSLRAVFDRLIAERRRGLNEADQYQGESDLFPVLWWSRERGGWDHVLSRGSAPVSPPPAKPVR